MTLSRHTPLLVFEIVAESIVGPVLIAATDNRSNLLDSCFFRIMNDFKQGCVLGKRERRKEDEEEDRTEKRVEMRTPGRHCGKTRGLCAAAGCACLCLSKVLEQYLICTVVATALQKCSCETPAQ